MPISTLVTSRSNKELSGLLLGLLAIACFSVTLPATRLAVSALDPTFVGLGRSLLAAVPALALIYGLKIALPTRRQWQGITVVMLGVVISFPWLTSMAMQNVSGAQGGIVVSMLPLFTAIAGALLLRQRPSVGFWLMAVLGSSLVVVYLLWSRHGQLQSSEFILLGASILCAIGYAQGGKLASEIGGIAVICWAIVLSVPFTIIPVALSWENNQVNDVQIVMHWQAWAGFIYVSFISQWLAFIFWYRGLALGGVIRVSQVQLIQPFLTLFVAALLLGESISFVMIVFCAAVVLSVAMGRRMPVYQ